MAKKKTPGRGETNSSRLLSSRSGGGLHQRARQLVVPHGDQPLAARMRANAHAAVDDSRNENEKTQRFGARLLCASRGSTATGVAAAQRRSLSGRSAVAPPLENSNSRNRHSQLRVAAAVVPGHVVQRPLFIYRISIGKMGGKLNSGQCVHCRRSRKFPR